MLTLNELKEPYIKNYNKQLAKYSCNEIAERYLASSSIKDQTECISYLVCKSWNLLQKIYHTKNEGILSTEDCYDIFIQTLHYVLKTHVWTKPESSLYGDNEAFIKAMAITIQSRRKNFLKAKYRQKRIANETLFSLDSLNEDFQEGYFYNYEEDYSEECLPIVKQRVHYYFSCKQYLTAFILDAIINMNIYQDATNDLDLRKLRKHLRNLNTVFCEYFANIYDLNLSEVNHSLLYFQSDLQDKLDSKIQNAFILLQNDEILRTILNR